MHITNDEKNRIMGLLQIERLQSEGMTFIEQGKDANNIADQLLELSQQTNDAVVSEMAMLAHAGISSGQLKAAGAALASVSDQIATATNTFNLAARIAQEGETNLTFPFIAGKAASLLDFLKTLEKTGNNKSRAADILGISSRTLRNKLKEYSLPDADGDDEPA
jgi:transcriptional regulator with GAF, ATPase, and Fis domain